MKDLSRFFPLPYTCGHKRYIEGGTRTGHGNAAPDWAEAETVACCYWTGPTSEPSAPAGANLATADVTLVVDAALTLTHQDRFVIAGLEFEVIGLPGDFDHGPHGYVTKRRVLNLRWTG